MGRVLRRVPLDFSWPMNKTWDGFLNNMPYGDNCPHCADGHNHSTGYSPFAMDLNRKWYGFNREYDPVLDGKVPFTPDHPAAIAWAKRQCAHTPDYYGTGESAEAREAARIVGIWNSGMAHFLDQDDVNALCEAGRLHDFTDDWTPRVEDGKGGWTGGWVPKEPKVIPTPEQVNVWSLGGFGHDSINQWIVIKDRCKRAGVSSTCSVCDGEGVLWASPEQKAAYEAWESTEPPEGEGYQLWENTSEGSAISPVFAKPEDLARYMADSTYADGLSAKGWMEFIMGDGFSMDMIIERHVDEEGNDAGGTMLIGAQSAVVKPGMKRDQLEALFSDIDS